LSFIQLLKKEMANSEGRGFTYNAVGEVLSELDAEANLIEMQYDRLGRLEERRANGELVGAWHFDNPDPNKGLGLLDYEDSLFQPDDTRLQKHYFYGDGSNGRKDLQQATHRLFKSDATDQNGV
jgi:YD repeat-containing protein